MKLHILFASRRGFQTDYPEALEVVDEGALDENPEIKTEISAEHAANKDLEKIQWFEIEFPRGTAAAIRERMLGTPKLTAVIADPKPSEGS